MKISSQVLVATIFLTVASLQTAASSSSKPQPLLRRELSEDHDHDHSHEAENCNMYEVDFVLVEDDAVRNSVESEIVDMLKHVGVKVNTRKLSKEDFNAAEQAGDFHLSFSETWGAPYDPHAYASGWVAQDEGHFQALAGLEAPDTKDSLFAQIQSLMGEEDHAQRGKKWEAIHKVVHDNAVMLPLWGKRIPAVLNSKRLIKYRPGNQQFDYPVHNLEVLEGPKNVTIAPGAQTGIFKSVGRLDPHTYRPNEFFANNWVYEGLVSYGVGGQILPALATNWTSTDLPEGRRYKFNLRPGVMFHDGAPWDCAVAKLNFDHVLATPLRTPDWHGWYGLMAEIQSWECTGTMELTIETKSKYYPFLQELSFIRPLRMLSPLSFKGDADPYNNNSCHAGWGTIEDATGGQAVVCAGIDGIAGTGPFKYESRKSVVLDADTTIDEEVVFLQNPSYWDGSPAIETLTIKYYETPNQVKAALLDGSLDLVWGSGVLTATDLIELDEDESNNLSVFMSEDIQNVIVLLNSGNPPLDDINVRKTIIHAIDKKTIIDDNLGGIVKPVDNVFPLDAPYCDIDLTPRWDYDLEKAEFLNCPDPTPDPVVEEDKALAVGLGVGLGALCAILLVLALLYVNRSKKLEKELAEMLLQAEKDDDVKQEAPANE
ncbi:MAG: hypothetical protein SGBAC_010328 [Bacillariaceae sp.]